MVATGMQDRVAGMVVLIRRVLAVAAMLTMFTAVGTARAQTPDPLSPARYAAIDGIKTAFIPFEDGPTAAEIANIRRVCNGLDRSDPLLALWREGCLTTLKLSAASGSFQGCQTRLGCSHAARRLAAAFGDLIMNSRASNRVVEDEVPAGPCRTQLRATGLRSAKKLRAALRLLARGLRTGDHVVIRRANRRISQAGREGDDHQTTTEKRDKFRSACAPAVTPAP